MIIKEELPTLFSTPQNLDLFDYEEISLKTLKTSLNLLPVSYDVLMYNNTFMTKTERDVLWLRILCMSST